MITPYYQDELATIYHADCRDVLPQLDDVDLVLTDPPYGIGAGDQRRQASRSKLAKTRDYGNVTWDAEPIDDCLMRDVVAKGRRACIWGGNYYAHIFDSGPGWLIWDKENGTMPWKAADGPGSVHGIRDDAARRQRPETPQHRHRT